MLSDESMVNRSSAFWGICCEGGKKYSQIVRQKFHMTMAALDPTVPTSPVVSLMVDRGGCEYLICSLKPGTLLQVNLNLYFDKGEKVTFSLIGKGKIHLSGYHLYEKNDFVPAETKEKGKTISPKKQLDKKVKESEDSESDERTEDNKKGKTISPKKKLDKKVEESEDSESDEDADEGTEDNKKDSVRLLAYKRSWSALSKYEEEEDSDYGESDEDSSKEIETQFQNKKKQKKENSEIISIKNSRKNTPGKSANIESLKLTKKTPRQDLLNSSIGRTPMPKKTLNEDKTNSLKTVTPKKVDFENVGSSDSDNKNSSSQNVSSDKAAQPTTPNSETKKKKKKKKNKGTPTDVNNATNESPAKPKGLALASYSQKLPGGLEYEDIRTGNGPIAKKGRLVHVYYTGMLENNKVFDSRQVGGKPFSFRLGSNNDVIQGWNMAIEGMKVGGKRRLKIPPQLGYANVRKGPIPPNSTLYFTVELKAVS